MNTGKQWPVNARDYPLNPSQTGAVYSPNPEPLEAWRETPAWNPWRAVGYAVGATALLAIGGFGLICVYALLAHVTGL